MKPSEDIPDGLFRVCRTYRDRRGRLYDKWLREGNRWTTHFELARTFTTFSEAMSYAELPKRVIQRMHLPAFLAAPIRGWRNRYVWLHPSPATIARRAERRANGEQQPPRHGQRAHQTFIDDTVDFDGADITTVLID